MGKKKKRVKKKKNPRTPTSVFISVIRYASRSELRGRTGRYHGDHELPRHIPRTVLLLRRISKDPKREERKRKTGGEGTGSGEREVVGKEGWGGTGR